MSAGEKCQNNASDIRYRIVIQQCEQEVCVVYGDHGVAERKLVGEMKWRGKLK